MCNCPSSRASNPAMRRSKRRFAAAAGAQYGQDFAGHQLEVNAVNSDHICEALGNAPALDQRLSHASGLFSRNTRSAMGMEEVRIIIKAGAAARAKNASEVADQTGCGQSLEP